MCVCVCMYRCSQERLLLSCSLFACLFALCQWQSFAKSVLTEKAKWILTHVASLRGHACMRMLSRRVRHPMHQLLDLDSLHLYAAVAGGTTATCVAWHV
jgi:hypothetical protein